MELIKSGLKIPFTRYRKIAVIISTIVNVAVLIMLFVKGPNLGVDFAGGTMVHLKFQQNVTIPDVRQAFENMDLGGSVIQDFGQPGSNEYLVRLDQTSVEIGVLGEQIKKVLTDQFGADQFEVRRIESVGPKIGQDLRRLSSPRL
jgi:preprotein translocase subunit SecF